jgi:hypothetical protein
MSSKSGWPTVDRSVELLLVLYNRSNPVFGSRRYSWPYFCFFQDFYMFSNGGCSTTRGGVRLIPVTPPLLGVLNCTLTHPHTHHSLYSITPLTDSTHLLILTTNYRSVGKLLLGLATRVNLDFESRWDPWPHFFNYKNSVKKAASYSTARQQGHSWSRAPSGRAVFLLLQYICCRVSVFLSIPNGGVFM